jgi:hypothetical protein
MMAAVTKAAATARWTSFPEVFAQYPTVFWWLGASDDALIGIGNVGVVTAVLALLSGWRVPLFLAAVCHLSLVTVGGPFITFPWDFLLLEVRCAFSDRNSHSMMPLVRTPAPVKRARV